MKKTLLAIGLLSGMMITAAWAGGVRNQTGHYIGGPNGGGYTGGGGNPAGGVYSATVRWNGHGDNYELATYNVTTMANCQNHVNASVGVGAVVVLACHYIP